MADTTTSKPKKISGLRGRWTAWLGVETVALDPKSNGEVKPVVHAVGEDGPLCNAKLGVHTFPARLVRQSTSPCEKCTAKLAKLRG